MIQKFEEFNKLAINEKRYPNDTHDYFETLSILTMDCAIANIEFVEEHGGRIEFKTPIQTRFYYGNARYDSNIIQLKRENIVALIVSDDKMRAIKDLELEDMSDFIECTEDNEYLIAITDKDEEIIVYSNYTCPPQTVFDINSELEYADHKGQI